MDQTSVNGNLGVSKKNVFHLILHYFFYINIMLFLKIPISISTSSRILKSFTFRFLRIIKPAIIFFTSSSNITWKVAYVDQRALRSWPFFGGHSWSRTSTSSLTKFLGLESISISMTTTCVSL